MIRHIACIASRLHNRRQVGAGPIATIFERPRSAYARKLIDAIPGRRRMISA